MPGNTLFKNSSFKLDAAANSLESGFYLLIQAVEACLDTKPEMRQKTLSFCFLPPCCLPIRQGAGCLPVSKHAGKLPVSFLTKTLHHLPLER